MVGKVDDEGLVESDRHLNNNIVLWMSTREESPCNCNQAKMVVCALNTR